MAPGTKPTLAFVDLGRARVLDRDLGSAYLAEIEQRLAVIAPRAASSFMASKDYESAFQAVKSAEQFGNPSSTTKSVRESLDSIAGELLRAATAERTSDPASAKKKALQIQAIVDPRSSLFARAKLISGP
jgi:hypothetical protein